VHYSLVLYTFNSRLPGPAAGKPVTGNADRSRNTFW